MEGIQQSQCWCNAKLFGDNFQKQSACISRTQSKNDYNGNHIQCHNPADDKYDCICNHECCYPDNYRHGF